MKTFKDNAGRAWTVSVDVNAVRRVRTALKVNLAGADLVLALQGLVADPVLLCDVIYVVVKPQADREKVSDEDFGRAMAGDAIEHATEALLAELADFTPNHRLRAQLRRALQAWREAMDQSMDAAERTLDQLISRALSEEKATSGPTSGSSPEQSASIQGP